MFSNINTGKGLDASHCTQLVKALEIYRQQMTLEDVEESSSCILNALSNLIQVNFSKYFLSLQY
jgi:hypothetical protein